MKKFIKTIGLCGILAMCMSINFLVTNPVLADENNSDPSAESAEVGTINNAGYDYVLSTTVTGGPIGVNLTSDGPEGKGPESVNNWIVSMIGYLINIFVIIGIAIAFIGGYKIMTANKEDGYKDGLKFLLFGIIGIIVMVSAKWIANVLVGTGGIMPTRMEPGMKGINLARDVYEKLAYPLIKIILYLVVGVLFFVMAGKVITYIISTDDVAKKKAGGIILWTVIGIFIIMGSKQIVESVMGKQEVVLKADAKEIGEIANDVLKFESIPIVANIINWVMGLAMFVVLILIIIQTYRMIFKPDDSKNTERIKKTLLYVIIGVLVIGASYIISNVLIIK